MNQDEKFMSRCIELASQGLGKTRTNPMVGCILVNKGEIVSEGFHQFFGGPHAEVETLNNITDHKLLNESVLYVTLEPCSHVGKTPPCCDLIIEKGIKKVIIASIDPNPQVNGKGIQKLKEAGIEVITGVLDDKNKTLNKRFFTIHEKKRPYIILKWAQSANGFIAPKNHVGQFKLTGELSSIIVHKWRSEESGILVGKNTIEIDDPHLTVRLVDGDNPDRIILDPENKISLGKHVHNNEAKSIFFNRCGFNQTQNNLIWKSIEGENFLENVLTSCLEHNIGSILVEGGAFTLQQFIQNNFWDEARIFTCKPEITNGIAAPEIKGHEILREPIEEDELTVICKL